MSRPLPPPGPFGPEHLTEEHRGHIFEGEPDEDLIQGLEPDQLVEVMNLQMPRARLGPVALAAFWVLMVLAAMAFDSFFARLRAG